MTVDEFISRARDRGLTLEKKSSGPYVRLEVDGTWVPLPGLEPGEELSPDTVRYFCEYLGLDPIDFELNPGYE